MHFLHYGSIWLFDRAFIAVDLSDLARIRGRLLIWSPPPSLAVPWVSEDHLGARLN